MTSIKSLSGRQSSRTVMAERPPRKLLMPSMMCADFANLADEINSLEVAGADIFHLDVMDGAFVPNFGLGSQAVSFICKHATIPCDVHMMVEKPGRYVEMFVRMGARIIYVHPEADVHICRTLAIIRDPAAAPGIAINPGTSFSTIEPTLNLVDYVCAMTVNPGFAGQQYLPFVNQKGSRLAAV